MCAVGCRNGRTFRWTPSSTKLLRDSAMGFQDKAHGFSNDILIDIGQSDSSTRRRRPSPNRSTPCPSDGEEEDHTSRMRRESCPIGQFFVNPCLFLSIRSRRLRQFLTARLANFGFFLERGLDGIVRVLKHGKGWEEWQRRIPLNVTTVLSAAALFTASSWIISLRRAPAPLGRRFCSSCSGPPVLIGALDFSGVVDVGGWMTPYAFPKISTLDPLGEDDDDGKGGG